MFPYHIHSDPEADQSREQAAGSVQGSWPRSFDRIDAMLSLTFAILQLLTIWFALIGGLGVGHGLLGIPWNSIGLINVIATGVGWPVLETPWFLFLIVALILNRRRSRN